MSSRYRLGIDIGGTFTDFALVDEGTRTIHRHKRLTSPADPSASALEGTDELLERAQISGGEIAMVVHGTTLVANAIIERKGAQTSFIVTKGFRDVPEMAHENRHDIYDLNLRRADPLVPRRDRYEIDERIDSDGVVLRELGADDLRRCIDAVAESESSAVAVALLHSFRNPAHENAIRDALAARRPDLAISISSEVSPEIREYERMSTTMANAYVQPLIARYLEKLEGGLARRGSVNRLYLMLSEGGLTTSHVTRLYPVRLVESGPAGGVLYSRLVGRAAGVTDMVAFDMGGTTAKACLIRDGRPRQTTLLEVARASRFKKGSGIPLRVPSMEIIEIGAGGGSIARLDQIGMLKVGPESAGAIPGPACYGQGGHEPTVTDANLLLGYLNPDYFLGGRLSLDRRAAERVVSARICEPSGLDLMEAADGIYRLVSEDMASAIRVHVAEVGADPRTCMLVAFGGAGPLHASYVARALKMRGFMCAPRPGIASAIGMLDAPISFDVARSFVAKIKGADLTAVANVFAELEARARTLLEAAGVNKSAIAIERTLDMRFAGQFYEVSVPYEDGSALTSAGLCDAFLSVYRSLFGHVHEDVEIEILTCRLRGTGPQPDSTKLLAGSPATGTGKPKGQRQAYFREWGGMLSCDVYERAGLRPGLAIPGPAIIEEPESTTIIEPDTIARIDEHHNIVVEFTNSTSSDY